MWDLISIPIAATVAECVTHPMDFVKTQKQYLTRPASSFSIFRNVLKTRGVLGFYGSLKPAVARHWIYTTTRVSLYEKMRTENSDFKTKAFAGISAGALAQGIASPADFVKVKLQTASLVSASHTTPMAILQTTIKKHGLAGLYRGWEANVMRSATVNLGELVAYDSGKQYLLQYMDDTIFCHALASFNSGLWSTALSTPADVVKTHMMANNHNSISECVGDIYNSSGIRGFWRGFFPIWMRLAPWQFTFWVSYEQLRKRNGNESFK
tara:strand:+ start:10762 stop:11562 length:801 start_codon:yes stop_codon:yes gene_type:complete